MPFLCPKNGVTQTDGAGVTQTDLCGVSHTEGAGLSHTAYAGLSHTDFVVQEAPVEMVLRFADIWTRMSIVQTVFSFQFISQIQGLFLRRRNKSCER